MGLNAHRVFFGQAEDDHFLSALTLGAERQELLRNARDACRTAIRGGLRNWSTVVSKAVLFEARADMTPASLKPKFKMQGSFAYRTINEPARTPPQEIDLDDGVFVPVSFLQDNGGSHPALISSGYFAAIEALLAPVCADNDWTLVTDKPSCVRVELEGDAHIDFALYAIPDEEFHQLVEAETLTSLHMRDSRAAIVEQIELADEIYRGLREDQIMLAHRDEGWKPSDPRKLEDWFRDALRAHGEQLRRVCRYLKGWRDHHWDQCRLSSIALMACVVSAYESGAGAADNRDDHALLTVAELLPGLLRGRLPNPVVDGQYLDEAWSHCDRETFASAAEALHERLELAISATDSSERALSELTAAFGERLPDDPDLIVPDIPAELSKPAVLTSGLVRDMGEETGPQSAVKRDGDRRYG